MGDMAEQFKELSEIHKEQRESRFNKWIDVILAKGGKELTYGVYRLGEWDLYPYKAGARNYKTGQRSYIGKVLR